MIPHSSLRTGRRLPKVSWHVTPLALAALVFGYWLFGTSLRKGDWLDVVLSLLIVAGYGAAVVLAVVAERLRKRNEEELQKWEIDKQEMIKDLHKKVQGEGWRN